MAYAKRSELAYGTYTVTETVFPDGYGPADKTSWQVTLNANTPNKTITLHIKNKKTMPGTITVNKTDPEGRPLAGAAFQLQWSTDNRNWKNVTYRNPYKTVTRTYATLNGTGALNIRSGPAGDHDLVGKLKKGDNVQFCPQKQPIKTGLSYPNVEIK